jgi:hypothetical protein
MTKFMYTLLITLTMTATANAQFYLSGGSADAIVGTNDFQALIRP